MRIFAAFLIFASLCSSQDVKVYHLDQADTDHAVKRYAAYVTAKAQWEGTQEGLKDKYLGKHHQGAWAFSSDFSVLIPQEPATTGTTSNIWGGVINSPLVALQ